MLYDVNSVNSNYKICMIFEIVLVSYPELHASYNTNMNVCSLNIN